MAKASVKIETLNTSDLAFAIQAPDDANITALRNVDVEGPEVAALAASINAIGQIVPVVYQVHKGKRYVIAGNHRLAAAMKLGRDVLAVDVAAFDGEPLEVALADQIIRSPLHPVDKFEAFSFLVDDGQSIETIALRFSITITQVRQALAIAKLSPMLRNAWREGTISAEIAQAFTLASDEKQQEKVFKDLSKAGRLSSWSVRDALIGDGADVTPMLMLVGADAYRAAGGKVIEDLFESRHGVSDRALLVKMRDEALDVICKRLVEIDGWSFAVHGEAATDRYSWRRDPIAPAKATKDEAARLKAIDKRITEIDELLDGDDDLDLDDERERLADEGTAIFEARTARAFTPEMRAKLGCVVDGDGAVLVGYRKGSSGAASGGKSAPAAKAKAAGNGDVSAALERDLKTWLKDATRLALKAHADERKDSDEIAVCMAMILADLIKPGEWNPALTEKHMTALREKADPGFMVDACRKAFKADDYFGRVPRASLVAIVKEAINADEAAKVAKMKAGDAKAYAIANVPRTGWLPRQMRAGAYALLTPSAKLADAKAAKKPKGRGSK